MKDLKYIVPKNVKTEWINIEMLKDFGGAILGIHFVKFKKNFSYLIDEKLAKIFFEQEVAISQKDPKVKPLILYLNKNRGPIMQKDLNDE